MIYEALIGFRGCNRYHAHSKIDEKFKHLKREGGRNWHYSIIQTQTDAFVGVLRTRSQQVIDTMPHATWKPLPTLEVGSQTGTCLIEFIPKHTRAFGQFRNDIMAKEHFLSRDSLLEALDDIGCELVSRSTVDIAKQGHQHHGPSAWFELSGRIKSQAAFERLVLDGTGGARAFGIGLLVPPNSQLHGMAKAVSEAKRDIYNM